VARWQAEWLQFGAEERGDRGDATIAGERQQLQRMVCLAGHHDTSGPSWKFAAGWQLQICARRRPREPQ
jgi:hypothetical protein